MKPRVAVGRRVLTPPRRDERLNTERLRRAMGVALGGWLRVFWSVGVAGGVESAVEIGRSGEKSTTDFHGWRSLTLALAGVFEPLKPPSADTETRIRATPKRF